MNDAATEYASVRERLSALLRERGDEAGAVVVATCPGWSVHDVVAHLAGTVSDVLAGRFDGIGTDAWTDAQVVARRGESLGALLDEWNEHAPQFEEGLRAVGGDMAVLAVADAWSHEQDVRTALGAPGGLDADVARAVVTFYTGSLGKRIVERGLPALRVVAGSHELVAGDGEPAATVRSSGYELARALTGRRTREQIAAYDWEGSSGPYLELFSAYGWPEAVVES